MSAVTPPVRSQPTRRFDNGAEWLASLGVVPLDRVIFDPWPGTATEADLLRLVERDKRVCELVDGTLVEKSMGYWEGVIAATVSRILGNYISSNDLGQVSGADSTMRMRAGNIRLPDVGFTAKDRLPKTYVAVPKLAPDLAVEVLSEGNTVSEIAQKLVEHFESGTRLAWVVDPVSRTVNAYLEPGSRSDTTNRSRYRASQCSQALGCRWRRCSEECRTLEGGCSRRHADHSSRGRRKV